MLAVIGCCCCWLRSRCRWLVNRRFFDEVDEMGVRVDEPGEHCCDELFEIDTSPVVPSPLAAPPFDDDADEEESFCCALVARCRSSFSASAVSYWCSIVPALLLLEYDTRGLVRFCELLTPEVGTNDDCDGWYNGSLLVLKSRVVVVMFACD